VYAGITVFSGAGITINASQSDRVILRGLTINSQGTGDGIDFNGSFARLQVESCVVNGFSQGNGLGVFATGQLEVKDSILRNNLNGILIQPAQPGQMQGTIDNVRLEMNGGVGLKVRDGAFITIRNSVASNNSNDAGLSVDVSTASAELNVENCGVSYNSTGIFARTSMQNVVARIRVSNSIVTDNVTGLNIYASPALIQTRGNNTIEGNGNDMVGTIGSYTGR
jgi:hypothetical protein